MPRALLPLYSLAGLGAGAVVLTPILMVQAFPPAVRFSGVSFAYNVVYALFGGFTPPLVFLLAHYNRMGPAHYIAVASLAGLLAIFLVPSSASINQMFEIECQKQPPLGESRAQKAL